MSTEDFKALNDEWVGGEERDFREWSQQCATRARETYEFTKLARESLLFSAWVNTLREEWEAWCRADERRRGAC